MYPGQLWFDDRKPDITYLFNYSHKICSCDVGTLASEISIATDSSLMRLGCEVIEEHRFNRYSGSFRLVGRSTRQNQGWESSTESPRDGKRDVGQALQE